MNGNLPITSPIARPDMKLVTAASNLLTWILIIGGLFGAVIGILAFALWIAVMIKAYQGEKHKIPWAGDFAEKQVS